MPNGLITWQMGSEKCYLLLSQRGEHSDTEHVGADSISFSHGLEPFARLLVRDHSFLDRFTQNCAEYLFKHIKWRVDHAWEKPHVVESGRRKEARQFAAKMAMRHALGQRIEQFPTRFGERAVNEKCLLIGFRGHQASCRT